MISAKTKSGYKIEIKEPFDDYVAIKYLERDCFSVTFLVKNKSTNTFFQARIISVDDATSQHRLNDIVNEITTQQTLNHPNILKNHRTLDLVKPNNERFIVTISDYCSEGNLLDYIENNKIKNNEERIYIEKQIIEAVKYLHQLGIAITIISLKNILICKNSIVKLNFSSCQICSDDSFIYFKADICSIEMILYSLHEGKQVKTVYDSEGHLQTRIEDIKARNLIDECTIKEASKRPNIEEVESNEYFTISEEEEEEEEKEEELRDPIDFNIARSRNIQYLLIINKYRFE